MDPETTRGVIFDVDGVLVDSYDAHFQSWQLLGREKGFRFSQRRFLETFGRTTREILRETLGDERLDDAELAAWDRRKEALFRDILSGAVPLMDGARELIDQLHEAGFRLAVGSSGPPENVQLVLDALHLPGRIGAVVTGVDVSRGKPHPDVFLQAAERLDVLPDQCAVIEDAAAGIEAAHRAGMFCVALVSKGHTVEELSAADATVVSLRELTPEVIGQGIDARRSGRR